MFKGSGHYTSTGRYPRVIGGENMAWHSPRRPTYQDDQLKAEKEEIDHAIVRSFAEDARKPKTVPLGYKTQADTDEGLARALQESLNMSSFRPYAPVRSFPVGYRICRGCNSDLSYGHYLSCMGAFWHPQCFCCHACGNPISESEFSLSGTDPYHSSCYKKLHHPKCDVCQQCIPTNRAGLIEYKAHPFWHQKCCPSHDRDNTPRCCSCERMESRNAKYISLGDGRSLCLECLDSAIMDTGDCQPLYRSIRDYFEGMDLKLDQQIPILLVERQALNEAIEGEKYGHRHTSETRGLCLSEEKTVRTIFTRPRIGGNNIIDMRTYPQKLTRKSEVTAILILYGLPRLLTGSILAHELMHGWFRLNGYRNIRPEVEEGICQVLSHMWLESEVMPGSRKMPSSSSIATSSLFHHSSSSPSSFKKTEGKSDMERKLGEFFLHHISHDSSLVYGEGFRAANAAVNRYGLNATLDHIRLTGYLPFK